ncbi:MAG: rRNA adenine N-6-methyltransferase family protein [Microthrixaceae bacterium]
MPRHRTGEGLYRVPDGSDSPPPALLTRTTLLSVMRRHGLEPRRTLGQNFVVDPNTIRRIVARAGVGAGDRVVEVGPGLGSLTLGLLHADAEVTVVELDDRVRDAWTEVTGGRARWVHADAAEVDWHALMGDQPWSMVANLPYNVSTPVMLNALERSRSLSGALVMVQREVGSVGARRRVRVRTGSRA